MIVTHGISIFSVGYLRRHCAQDTCNLGIVSGKLCYAQNI